MILSIIFIYIIKGLRYSPINYVNNWKIYTCKCDIK